MRLNPFDTDRIRVGTTGGSGGGRAGTIGCGTIVIAAVGYFALGLDPFQTVATVEGLQQQGQLREAPAGEDERAICSSNEYATETCNALQSLNTTWAQAFAEQGVRFEQPALRFATAQQFDTGCGLAEVGMGPFYCPADQTIYIDVNFYDQLARMSDRGGDFARYYVIAHEFGHHIQTITGVAEQIRNAQQRAPHRANQLQVRMELQADCYAGVWAGKNRDLIEAGDIEEGMAAATAIGDDVLTQGRVSPENFTHGTARQRSQALQLGLQGDDRACDRIDARG